jgi:hypothetical protein
MTPTPTLSYNVPEFLGVSCSSSSECSAVGLYNPPGSSISVALAETWDGSGWVADSTPPTNPPNNVLASVSCVPQGSCTAVGWFGGYNGEPLSTLVETTGIPASTTTLTSNVGQLQWGETLALTATVTSAAETTDPTGSVEFVDGGAPIGTAPLDATSSGYQASFATSTLSVGTHHIVAVYSGDANHLGSQSPAIVVTVTPAQTALAATPALLRLHPFTLELFTLHATLVRSDNGTPLAGQPITFASHGTTICANVITNAGGTASCNALSSPTAMLQLLVGNGYTATYSGATDFAASTTAASLVG